ncbi:hypothetical protein [Tabrizicola sp.]|uniref:hypothetical protein n=1 Tax=Tabrizicola sp. TaxID=2005166 RepID=UPI002FDE9B31
MPYVVALIGIVIGAYFWMQRARTAADAARELTGVAQDVMSAARRFGFRRRANVHPVEALEDPDVAIAGAGIAFLELGGLPSSEQHDQLVVSLQRHLGQSTSRAEEALILGRWLVGECGGAQPGLSRMARRLYKLRGADSFQPLMAVLKDVAAAGRDGVVSTRQREALNEIAALYRIS